MSRQPIDTATLERAQSLIARGLSMRAVAARLGVHRSTLYLYGFRSVRGYTRNV